MCVWSLGVLLPSDSRRGLPSERAPFCLQSDLRLSGSRGTCTQQSLPVQKARRANINTNTHTHTHTRASLQYNSISIQINSNINIYQRKWSQARPHARM